MNQLQTRIVTVTPFQQNCALLWNPATMLGAVIDPGGEAPRIAAAVQTAGVTVERIYLTHGHLDHAGGAAELAALLGVEIVGPDRRDQFLLDSIAAQAAQYGLTGMVNARPDRWLAEGESIVIGGAAFEVLHCPGHTPGHVVFVDRASKFGIFGDVLFRGSIGRTDFPYGDTEALLTAIDAKLLPLPDDFSFICGHGPPSTIGAERRSNPFLLRRPG